ncbi:MAG: hypothetical protein KC588_04560 [Nitrospira sp.]|nr:hypothetical protein [Nitrospira sp.]
MSDLSALAMYTENDEVIPLQAQVTTRWNDQSIQWALLDFLMNVEPHETMSCRLECQESPLSHPQDATLSFTQHSDDNVVETGAASFFLNPMVFTPFKRVVVDGVDRLDERRTSFILTDVKGQRHEPQISRMVVESHGPVRLTLRFDGVFSNNDIAAFRFIARLSFFAGSTTVMLKFTLHNPQAARHPGGCWDLGDDGSLFFKDFSWQLALRESGKSEHGWNVDSHEPMSSAETSSLEIYQDSSGGPNWNSPNHVNRFGQVRQRYPGYRVMRDGVVLQEGKRATPSLSIKQADIALSGTIQHFWQNFPKALEAEDQQIRLRLFPHQFDDDYELQGGEQKTHTCVVAFTKSVSPELAVNWIHDSLRPVISPEWYAGTKAIPYLSPRSEQKNVGYAQYIDTAIQEPDSWVSRREQIDEYGWRHFGEVYADHEAVNSSVSPPFISHYNNQYDVIYGLVIEYLRTGEERWFLLMQDLVKHVIDIDIYHTREDRPAYNGGLFWHTDHYADAATATHRTYSRMNREKYGACSSYGGGPSNEHNYTTGLLCYHFLTGDPLGAEAVQGLADWVINMDDPQGTILGKLDRRPTGLASSTVERAYHGPGRGAGNSVNALIDAYVLTKEKCYLLKAEELIQRCIHPRDDISRHQLEDIEHRWSYTVFLAAVGKYLDWKVAEGELDQRFVYARAALLHYAEWMVEHEVPYNQVLDRVEIPTETWPAQDMRKSHVLNVAAKYAEGTLRTTCQKKARFFFDACLTDLNSFKTCTLTRPVVLVMTNGYVQAYCDLHPDEAAPLPSQSDDFGFPKKFTPQGDELYRLRETLSGLVGRLKRMSKYIITLRWLD